MSYKMMAILFLSAAAALGIILFFSNFSWADIRNMEIGFGLVAFPSKK